MRAILDDQGREHPAPPIRAGVIPDPDHPATRAMIARIGDATFGGSRGCAVIFGYTLVMPIVVFLTCGGIGVAAFATRSPLMAIVAGVAVVMGSTFVLLRIFTPDLTLSLARALRHVGRCGSCCHPLAGAPSESGFTRCSECGAAWATDSIRAVHVPEADVLGARRLRKALVQLRTPRFRYRDRRGRFILPLMPRARWMRGTPHAAAARRVRWSMYGLTALALVTVIVMVSLTVSLELESTGLFIVFAICAATAILGSLGQPLLLIAIMRRHGLCPACSNPLDAAKCCEACGAAWGATVPPPPAPPTSPPSSSSSSRHPPLA